MTQALKGDRNAWMVSAQSFLVDAKGLPHQWLGLTGPVGGHEQVGEVVEGSGVLGMSSAMPRLHGVGVAFGQRDGLSKFAGTVELKHAVVDGF